MLATYAYFTGYSYIKGYYRAFEVDASILDISVYNHLVYSFFALNSWRGALACVVLLVLYRLLSRLPSSPVTVFVFAAGVS